jgi:hypothetical protein
MQEQMKTQVQLFVALSHSSASTLAEAAQLAKFELDRGNASSALDILQGIQRAAEKQKQAAQAMLDVIAAGGLDR